MWQSGENPDVTVITYGRIVTEALTAAKALAARGITVRILLCEVIAPVASAVKPLLPLIAGEAVLFLEEGVRQGGFAESAAVELEMHGKRLLYRILAVENCFLPLKRGETPAAAAGIDAQAITRTVNEMIKETKK